MKRLYPDYGGSTFCRKANNRGQGYTVSKFRKQQSQFSSKFLNIISRHSVGGIATLYGLDGPGVESRWGKVFL
jgi:hypothetical protein